MLRGALLYDERGRSLSHAQSCCAWERAALCVCRNGSWEAACWRSTRAGAQAASLRWRKLRRGPREAMGAPLVVFGASEWLTL